jgi:hypothetical protein
MLQVHAKRKKDEDKLFIVDKSNHFRLAPSPESDFINKRITSVNQAKVGLDKLLSNEIDLTTFQTGIDVILPSRRKDEDIGYI